MAIQVRISAHYLISYSSLLVPGFHIRAPFAPVFITKIHYRQHYCAGTDRCIGIASRTMGDSGGVAICLRRKTRRLYL